MYVYICIYIYYIYTYMHIHTYIFFKKIKSVRQIISSKGASPNLFKFAFKMEREVGKNQVDKI